MAVDIGGEAIDRALTFASGSTYITKVNPASVDGKITSIDVWAESNIAGLKVATFYRPDPIGSPDNFTARDVATIGDVTAGSKQSFTTDDGGVPLSIEVQVGDYLGRYFASGTIERDGIGDLGLWYLTGDETGCVDTTFTDYITGRVESLGGYVTPPTPMAGGSQVPVVIALDLI